MRWWAEAYRTANFSLGGPDIREQVGRPRLRLREPPARQGWRLLHARRRRPHHTARRGREGSPSRWATAISRQWPTSSMADRSLSPRTTVRRIEASVIGRLVNWTQVVPGNPLRDRLPGPTGKQDSKTSLCPCARSPAPFPRKQPAGSVIQQPVLRSPHHDLLLRVNTQLDLNRVDGVSDGDHLDFPCLRNRNV